MSAAQGKLDGLVALVTGGGGGIGAAIAHRLADEGARITVADIAGAPATAAAIGDDRAAPDEVDLTDRARRDGLVERTVRYWGRLDILVNNAAAHGTRTGVADLGYEDWDAVIETNLATTTFLSRQAAQAMRDGGAIVNIASIQQRLPLPSYAAYIASKGGVSAVSNALAVELAPEVRVNVVAPGVIATESFGSTPGASALAGNQARPATLLGRTGRAGEVAAAVCFLAGPDASFITGATLTVDGGRTLSRQPDPLATG
jgi:NAD(P)-dependent dehydrogenase (short-subunit alcohol dehydrogenase family)